MTENEARELGRTWFSDGNDRCPLADPAFEPFIKRVQKQHPNSVVSLVEKQFRAWLEGWDQANVDKIERDYDKYSL